MAEADETVEVEESPAPDVPIGLSIHAEAEVVHPDGTKD